MTTFFYRDPNAVRWQSYLEVVVRDGRLFVPDDRGRLVESHDWAFFVGLWRAGRDRAADGRSQ